jgi:preprotein translocase subunit SecF
VKLVNFNKEKLGLLFVKHRNKYFLASGMLILLGLLIIAFMGLNLGVDFEGGTRLGILIEDQPFTIDEVSEELAKIGLTPGDVPRLSGNENEIVVVLFNGTLEPDKINEVKSTFKAKYGEGVDINESTVSPIVARELAVQAILAVLLASIGIVVYVAVRFEYRFAFAAIIALFHDALIVIAVFSILRLEVDLTFIAAVLTVVGYSINDTIVIFDRIRENLRLSKVKTMDDLAEVVQKSIADTLTRSINTTLTTAFAATTLFLFGGEGIRNFSFALLIGLIAGAYSSIFIAAQVWLVWKGREIKRKMFNPQAES